MSDIIWKDIYFIRNDKIYDYRGFYKVSNAGDIKSLHGKNERIIKQFINNKGYYIVNLHKKNNVKKITVHSLVAHMFIENLENKPEIDHIDGDKSNNNVKNLRWVTRKENLSNVISKERHKKAMKNREITDEWKKNISNATQGSKNPRAKKIIQYDLSGNLIKVWDYIKQASEELLINKSGIINCCRGKNKTAGGYIWRYYEDCEESNNEK